MSPEDRPTHLRAWEALPWVANGRATPEQAKLVAEHLADCEDCRDELAWQRRLHAALSADDDHADSPDDALADAGLKQLLARIDANAAPAAQAAARGGSRLTWALAAAVVIQSVGIGVLSLSSRTGREGTAPSTTAYQTLSEPAHTPSVATLRVLPDAGMRLADWQALLKIHQLQVVAGPNAAGAYALAPSNNAANGSDNGPATAPGETLARLRASPGVRMAEPIGTDR